MNKAIIDLGTNTFHVLIFNEKEVVYKQSTAAKLGMGGINQGLITEEGIERGVKVLQQFREKLDQFQVEKIFAFGTSALRVAKNQAQVLQAFEDRTGIKVSVIDGEEEAQLIYEGVRKAVPIEKVSLIVDIGGGSVEFILCNPDKILWKQSFEIGGQRLVEKYMNKDPLPMQEIPRMQSYFREALLPLTNAIHQYSPEVLIGSSGSFDTLNDMYFQRTKGTWPPQDQAGFDYPLSEFQSAYEQLVFQDREKRMAIPGMRELRVDMIVVAMVLIRFLIEEYKISEVKISNYALKEGAMNYAQ
ncbi:Ppx/GppA phosphatase [Leadbetterella byssophila DSM 17132]|uniref:Ppx/GppA phosphatase n=1 Tax=Leadbetterella byssophila (strain DSM 17132 / JCM 16389 / KACC 11308 / NBRC 106382 / 4M15) TaxID=649349 RepID=E4RU51_LEAB4|nr:phosphatase [Leadbetterella byssophila]ADQ16032.1 Ppx/GppA phosphatase [Leadbetterella byssophila DSM 17132]